MTFEKAIKKAQVIYPKDYVCQSALDMGEFWAFFFSPPINKDEWYGGGYTTVNKNTGEIGSFIPPDNFELFSKAKRIEIK